MVFNSLDFFYLVIITFSLYYLPLFKQRQLWLLVVASFVFYAWNFPMLLILLLFSILINAGGSFGVAHFNTVERKRLVASISVVFNLVVLALFKYAGLFGRTLLNEQSELVDFLVAIPLPVGISFFTFQGISLVIDTFRQNEKIEGQKQFSESFLVHLKNTSLFISLFPQLVAGPIVKAHDFYPQIKPKYINDIEWDAVFQHLVIGFFLKMVVADNLKDFTFELTWPYFERLSSIHLIVLLFAYSIQIFADFAGYSLIAIGLSLLFGYKIPSNFNYPYIATSFSDFWRRWHISLSSFLKEYLYLPLGGNRKGKMRTYLNLMIVMALGGLWHGAAWSYMLWGIAHGFFLALERFGKDFLSSFRVKYSMNNFVIIKIIKACIVFLIVSVAWLLFKLPDFSHVLAYFNAVANNQEEGFDSLTIFIVLLYCFPVVLYHLYTLISIRNKKFVCDLVKPAVLAIMLVLILLNSGSPQDFIYFQF